MISGRGVIVMTNEPETERAIAHVLSPGSGFALDRVCHTLQDLAARLRQGPAAAAVVDIDPSPDRTLAMLDAVTSRFPETRFIVVSRSTQQSLLLAAMQAGARHFLTKASLSGDLVPVLTRLVPAENADHLSQGSVVTVLSASGGCGSTTITVNLANELNNLSSRPVLLVDMDSYCGAIAGYLGIEPHYGLDAVLSDEGRIDGELIRSAAAQYSESMFVLQAPSLSSTYGGAPLRYENMGRFIAACRSEFAYTVIDAPRLPISVISELAASSVRTFIPFQLTVLSIRAAKAMINALVQHGVPSDQIFPVANRYRKGKHMLNLEEAQKALGRSNIAVVENDFKAAAESANFGRPLAQSAPRSDLRRDIRNLASQVHESASRPIQLATAR